MSGEHPPAEGYRLYRWWLEEEGSEAGERAWSVYEALEEQDRGRQECLLHFLRLYGNLPYEGINASSYNKTANSNRVTWNVVGNVCDYANSRIGKQRPVPKCMPEGGNRSISRRAKLLDRFLKAQFRVSKVFETGRRVFLDQLVFGTGIFHPHVDGDEVCVERVFPGEVLVDHHEGLYGEPRQMFRRKWVSRDVLMEMFKDDERACVVIRDSGPGNQAWLRDFGYVSEGVHDMVLVAEGWHLPSGSKCGDGKHILVTDAGWLLYEDYKHDHFPFVFSRWKERLRGFWGMGLAEELNGIQVEINRMLIKVQTAFHLNARPLILVEGNSKLVKAHFTNEIATFVPYMGTKPEVWAPQNFHAEFYAHLERLDRKAYEIAGFTQEAATARIGAEASGRAIEGRHDVESERFSVQALNWEETYLEVGSRLIDCAEQIAKRHRGKYAITAPSERDKYTIETLDWKDVEMDRDKFVLSMQPESYLPQLPGPRRQAVGEMIEMGLITDPREARSMLNHPDTEAKDSLDQAMEDAIERDIETMLDEGEYVPPEPYNDLNLAFKLTQMHLNRARAQDVPEDRLDLLRDYLNETHKLQQRAAIEQQKLAMQAGEANVMAPPAAGAPPAPGPEGQAPTAATPQP